MASLIWIDSHPGQELAQRIDRSTLVVENHICRIEIDADVGDPSSLHVIKKGPQIIGRFLARLKQKIEALLREDARQ